MGNEPNKASTIDEAAQMLGVSKRTIYRRLRSGSLSRVKKSDEWIVGSSQIVPINSQNNLDNDISISGEMAKSVIKGDMRSSTPDPHHTKELDAREEKIHRLETENQQLRQSLALLQEQMYELAKQTVAQAIQTQPHQIPTAAPRRTPFAAFFARKR